MILNTVYLLSRNHYNDKNNKIRLLCGSQQGG